jgi:hypothetical protein
MQWTCASLTFKTNGAGAQLQFSFDVAPSTTLAPLGITGDLTFNGAPQVVVDAADLAGGIYPLLVVGGAAPLVAPELRVQGDTGGGSRLFWGGPDNKTLFFALPGEGAILIVR